MRYHITRKTGSEPVIGVEGVSSVRYLVFSTALVLD